MGENEILNHVTRIKRLEVISSNSMQSVVVAATKVVVAVKEAEVVAAVATKVTEMISVHKVINIPEMLKTKTQDLVMPVPLVAVKARVDSATKT